MSEKFRVEAHHAYAKTKADELDLSSGDIIQVTSDEHASWWVGHKEGTNEQGWFPSNFVRKIEPKPESKPKSKPKLKREVRIIKQYDAADEDDLSLKVGDIVEIKKEVDGWYLGRLNGNIGMFPVNYAEEHSTNAQAAASRPLPVPPVHGASNAPPPIPSLPPVPGVLSRRGTTSGTAPGGGPPGAPPSLPSRTPPLPPRASTDISRLPEKASAGDEGADDGKKDKTKSSHRISRLFGSKKHKHKEGQLEGVAESASPRMDQPPAMLDDEEPVDESSISPAIPSRPLPQPGNMNSPPPPPTSAGRSMPPIPAMGAAKLPPLPTAAMPPQPLAGIPQEPAAPRRPSVSSIGTASSVSVAPVQPLPDIQKSASNISAEYEDGNEQVSAAIAEDEDHAPQAGDEAGAENTDEADSAEPKPRPGPKLAKIIEDYEAESPEELNLMQGDVVTIISQGTENEDRWKGEYHGKKGYFPGNVVELIDESAEADEKGEESGEASSKPKGFKLAAYGVQQGGIGSIFAAGGMPALRKSAPRKSSEAEPLAAAPVPAPAQAPVIPKLRSVQRPAPKEEPKEEQQQQQQPNFLAQLNRVPRRPMQSASSEESISISPQPMPAPAVPISRKLTASSSAEPETADSGASGAAPPTSVPEPEPRDANDSAEAPDIATVSQEPSERHIDASADPTTEASRIEDEFANVEQNVQDAQAAVDDDTELVNNGGSALDPVKSPALSNVKRLVRRGPRQMPTAEGLKKGSEESQAQSLRSALQKDKSVEPEPEAEAEIAKATRPALPEKPRGISGRFSQHGGPQLPSGGFKASGRVGSAMASRLAALQARASGNNDDDEGNSNDATPNGAADTASPSAAGGVRSFGAPKSSPSDATSPPPVGRKPSFTPRTSHAPESHGSPAISSEWQKQIEEEQTRLRSDINKAKNSSEAVERLESRLSASERENQTHKQTISRLEEHIQALTAQLSTLKTDISGIQRSVAGMSSNKGVTANEVTSILRSELGGALQPLEKQTQSLSKENKALDKKISDLRAYVDELVVDEE
ncbi:hypothetical protein IW138_004977 [Coemansia sp. RSA 986]|nr:hypothetical protein IW138_004977 [Coemansia sp. RSA 986]